MPWLRISSNRVPRKLGQERGVVGRINELRLLRFPREFLDIVHRADRHPDFTELVDVDMAFHPLPDVLGGEAGPYHVGHIRRAVVDAGLLRTRLKQTRSAGSILVFSLQLKPFEGVQKSCYYMRDYASAVFPFSSRIL